MHKTRLKKTSPWARTGRTAALTALIGAMLGTAAFAQFGGRPPGPPPPGGPRFGGPGGGQGRGMRGPRPSTAATAPLPALAAGLKLTSAQQAKIAKIQSTFSGQRRSMMPPPPPPGAPPPDFRAIQGRMRGMEQSADAGVQAVLTGPQKAALPGLLKTLDDLRMAGIPPATYGALKLTGAQTARIAGMAQASQQAMSRTMGAPGLGGDPRSAMRASRDRLAAQAAAVLTPTQRAIVDKYKAAHPRPAFGGGFGGPRGGPGGPPPGERRSQDEDHGRPVILVAQELGVTPDQFRAAFRKVHPAGAGQEPTQAERQANRRVLSESLGVSPERLDAVMDKYRPGGRGTNGPPPQVAPPPDGNDQ